MGIQETTEGTNCITGKSGDLQKTPENKFEGRIDELKGHVCEIMNKKIPKNNSPPLHKILASIFS